MAGFKKKSCHAWASGQKCRFGDKCHYSHEGSQNQNSSNSQQDRVPLTSSETKFRAWNFKLKGSESLLTIDKLSNFFRTAQQLIDSEAGVRQDVIKSLATEGGLTRVAQLASQQYPFGVIVAPVVLREQIIPLFNVLTHPEIFSSLLMEEPVAVICGFLYGVEGQRLVRLYDLVIKGLKDTPARSQEIDTYFTVSLQLLAKIIDTKTESQVNKTLHPIANSFEELIKERNDSQEQPDLQEASMLLARVQYRLGLGSELPAAIPTRNAKAAKASFIMQREPAGGRHNNDFGDITQIEIMPTFDEISSRRAEYLPHLKFDENYVQGLDGVFDRHFRLLREDTIGQLRDAVQAEMEKLQHRISNHSRNGTRTYSYNNLAIERLVPDPRCGFKVEISFDQPALSRAEILSDGELARKNWWLQSKRLDPDALVCLAEVARATGTILFCTVDQGSKPKGEKHRGRQSHDDSKAEKQFRALYSSKERGSVSLVLEDPTAENIQKLLRLCRRQAGRSTTLLVEFPGILLPAFKPTLLALKQMKETGDLPLKEMLIPSPVVDEEQIQITPPAYTQKRGFRFNLKCLMSDSSDLFLTPGQPFDAQKLQTGSLLDDAQTKALVDSLCRSLALIQGPPGTGKSFVGVALTKVLLANKEMMIGGVPQTGPKGRNDIGPIIVVTYTNHALDQLLEHLHHAGVKQIIRIGSGCKSEVLQDCNLRSVARTEQRTKHEKSSFFRLRKEKEKEVDPQFSILNTINDSHSPTALKGFLLLRWPHHHDELFEQNVDEEGFQEVVYKRTKAPQHVFGTWLSRGPPGFVAPRSVKILASCRLVEMSRAERYKLYHSWETQFQEDLEQKLLDAMTAHVSVKDRLDAIQEETDLRCLRAANIIGLTTSGLARNLAMLRKLRSKVLICEEAGEVLEAHLLTTFLPSVEHAILIGDHQQLRPQVQNYELRSDSPQGKQYSLDISLFERLVHPGPGIQRLPYSTLETQRRMHPSISRLIRETMYPELKDAANVDEYPEITGLRKRLFWLDHTKPEGGEEADVNQTSHFNAYEVQMTAALVRHIVNQGAYRPEDIAVLTPYLGQLQRLRNALGSAFAIVLSDRDVAELDKAGIEEVMEDGQIPAQSVAKTTLLRALRLSTVDNFQGEEAKVIILSLVRSNTQNKVGFLGTSNRINVALSRAKHGMVIIGNSQSASAKVAMWAEITAMLTEDGNLGPSICGESCPSVRFCQICTSDDDVKATTVDFIEMSTYEKVDLDANPCIFPPCGHFLTAQSMDAQMSMSQYYEMDDDDRIIGIKQTLSVPFSIDEIKRCATCRGSLRSIGRYGRLIRRAMLDEATKRFIVWSNAQYIPLAKALQTHQDALPEKEDGKAIQALSINGFILPENVQGQAEALWALPGSRYKELLKLRAKVFQYGSMVSIEEQPFKRVLTLTQNPRLCREGVNSDLSTGDSLLQTRASVLAMALLLRTDLVTLSDVINLCQYASTNDQHGHFAFDFSENKDSCAQLIAMASASSNRLQEVEGHMFYAQYTALERQFPVAEDQTASTKYRLALDHMDKAKQLSELYKHQTRAIHTELKAIEKMLKNGTFYDPITSDEMKEVLAAMATEFRGTGHWYYCTNGHPFTIGECGMPMQTARCPQCGATIGGHNHAAVEGVSRAADLEEQLRGLAI
ncbi:3'(2')-5'-bisphosphate nucleotidase [Venturia nashicola]|uniref:3'(2')-5'-bisphosphate nucleotidase n=1 Tax=Venturia nashicola TaxID=86259 RepID=A0A4Z1P0N6_9PEZI|nr:3'(2')-5'-bisphosphate nucleotidase [Venturia nashicola]TLD32430.1 3'(2')-5'-bisphosphate nucleotidase [Venturia nashicola]